MRIPRAPHRWSVTPTRAVALQRRLSTLVRQTRPRRTLRLVAGLDAAFTADERHVIAAVVLWDLRESRALEQHIATRPLTFPYIPGLLSFRETPALIAALRQLRTVPDVLMCDGHGLAHPRRFGIACHVGVVTNLPTIGCAKSRLVGRHSEPAFARGAHVALEDNGQVIGSVLRTQDGVRPVFVSIGHLIDLRTATAIVLACALRYRLPEPIRLADQCVAAAKRHLPTGR
jgi:deoxyribonuclease V